MNKYKVFLYDENDMLVATYSNVEAPTRYEALINATGGNSLDLTYQVNDNRFDVPEFSSWDAIEIPDIQPKLLPDEEVEGCTHWHRMVLNWDADNDK
jgi:hypothetical protein